MIGVAMSEARFDLIGLDTLHGRRISRGRELHVVRIRVAGRTETQADAMMIGNEVESLYTNGPAGGGGAWKSVRQIVAIASALVPENFVTTHLTTLEV